MQDSTSMPDQPNFSLEDARSLFDATPFVGWSGLTVEDLGDGWAPVRRPCSCRFGSSAPDPVASFTDQATKSLPTLRRGSPS